MFILSRRERYFTPLDLASGFFLLNIAETDEHGTGLRNYDGVLQESIRAGFGFTFLSAAFT